MKIEILNSFAGDNKKEIDTANPEGRAEASKLVNELIRSGSAVFLEKEVNGEVYTYRVTGYDPEANKLTIKLDSSQVPDADIETVGRKRGPGRPRGIPRSASYGRVAPETGTTVSVAPRSGG